MDINDLTLGQIKEIGSLSGANNNIIASNNTCKELDNRVLNKKCIIRTYSAGVWYGTVSIKDGNEIILTDARRLYYWKCANSSATLSGVASHGLTNESKVMEAVKEVWLQPIEIILCNESSIKSIEDKENYVAK